MLALSQAPGIDPVKDSSAALQAALNLKTPIAWDCPVALVMGEDTTKSVFVPDGSDVTFMPKGQVTVDNIGFPALCFYNAAGIWRGLNLNYVGAFGATCVAMPYIGNHWNDVVAKAHLGVTVNPLWSGPTNTAAVISVKGNSAVQFLGGQMVVPADAPASSFIPTAIAFDAAYGNGLVAPTATVQDFLLDGVYMGFVGGAGGNFTFKNVTRNRYSDFQDAAGNNIGGLNTWFAPPHFFYLDDGLVVGALTSPPLTGSMRNIVDNAQYVGNPLRRLSSSGMMHSLKLELANGFLVDGYYSRCLDGGFDCISMGRPAGGTMRNAFFLIDSSITTVDGKQVVSALRFPSPNPMPPGTDIDLAYADRSITPGWSSRAYAPGPWPGVRVRVSGEYGVG